MTEAPTQPQVRAAADAHEFFTEEQCHIRELSNSAADPQLSIAQARVEPGVITRWHYLEGISERYCITAGSGEVEIGDQPPQAVGPGDVVLIPPGCRQRIRNTGGTDLLFLAICTPRFRPQAYHAC